MTQYDLLARLYNPVSHLLRVERPWREAVGRALQGATNVLDVGCGTGFQWHWYPGSVRHVVGLDSSQRSLQIAAQQARNFGFELTAIVGDANHASFGQSRFDAAVAVFALSVVNEWESVLRRMAQALKPGGVLIVLEQCTPTQGWARAFSPVARALNVALGATLDRPYREAVERIGCSVVERRHPRGWYQLVIGTRANRARSIPPHAAINRQRPRVDAPSH